MTTVVLHSDDAHHYKIVQLSLDTGNRYHDDVTMTIARISEAGITLARLKETPEFDEDTHQPIPPEKIALAPEELDALVDAWMTFKSEQLARKVAEEARKVKLLFDARLLAVSVTTSVDGLRVTIEPDNSSGYYYQDYFHVKVPALNYHRHCHIDQLVWNVQDLIDQTERYIARMEDRDGADTSVDIIIASYIAAWRAVRPLPVSEKEAEQGVDELIPAGQYPYEEDVRHGFSTD